MAFSSNTHYISQLHPTYFKFSIITANGDLLPYHFDNNFVDDDRGGNFVCVLYILCVNVSVVCRGVCNRRGEVTISF